MRAIFRGAPMSVSFTPATRTDVPAAATGTGFVARASAILLPLALLLAWTAAVRLPFYFQTDKDEFFFSIIATQWLQGGLPYVATFDIKPPGLFVIYAIAQSLFGASQVTIKGMEIVAVALGAYALYGLVARHGTQRAALWVAILFPIYTLSLGGAIAVNMLLQLPFLIAGFAAALTATDDGAGRGERLVHALLAGLAIGAAGMVKQTAIFEAVAVFAVLCLYGERGVRWRLAGLFVVGAAIPALAFALYFAAAGHFREMYEAVILLALARSDAEVAASYGPELARYFTLPGAIEYSLLATAVLVFLWGGAAFAILRRARIVQAFPARLLVVAGIWLVAAFAGVVAGRAICSYYVLTMVPPLLILAAAFFCHGLEVAPGQQTRAFVLSLVAAAVAIGFADRENLFTPNAFLAGDYDATREVSETIRGLGLGPEDRLLVLNRGFAVYAETGAMPPGPYFHATHLLAVFHTPSPDSLGETLAANPRFVVVANPAIRHGAELRARYRQALDYLARHYRVAGAVTGARDSFTIYEFVN